MSSPSPKRRPRSSDAPASSPARTLSPTPTTWAKGYGIPTEGGLEAISMFAQLEGILLDPVYSAKGAAGLIDLIRKGRFRQGRTHRVPAYRRLGGAVRL